LVDSSLDLRKNVTADWIGHTYSWIPTTTT
jgi:hypothetical protein